MTKQDVEIAIKTASNALDNNFVLAAAQGALLLAGGLYLAYEMYKKGGEEKAADHLVQNKTAQKVPGGYLFKDKFYESPKSLWQAFVTTHTVLKAFIQYKMDAAPQDVTFKDQGFDVETNKPKINSTPIHDEKPWQEGYDHAPQSSQSDQGFQPYDGPSGNILNKSNFEVGENIDLQRFTERLKGGMFKEVKTGQSITPDRARNSGTGIHGGSYWKLLDKFGKRIGTVSEDGRFLRK